MSVCHERPRVCDMYLMTEKRCTTIKGKKETIYFKD